jgi:hypothetical protein
MPHGIRYSLTLHDRNNTRVIGYDNAHAVKPSRKKFGAVKTTWDHAHRNSNRQGSCSKISGAKWTDL